MNTVSYSDHDPRESYDYKLGQKEAWAEIRELSRSVAEFTDGGTHLSWEKLDEAIEAKLSSFKEGE